MAWSRHYGKFISPLVACCCLAVGCAEHEQANPSFPLSIERGKEELKAMALQPVTLERPVIVLAGWGDPGAISASLAAKLRHATGDERIMSIAFPFHTSFNHCRATVLVKLDQEYPSEKPDETIEVDVVAISMGSLVARYAALPPPEADENGDGQRRLRIVRLFTIAGPHRGAELAMVPSLDTLIIDMRPGSAFLVELDEGLADADYTIYPYARLHDGIVGEQNTAPPGEVAWWVPNTPFAEGHLAASSDPRILADIARRLRGEQPYTTEPRAPLPVDE